jgi:hypothetical protein
METRTREAPDTTEVLGQLQIARHTVYCPIEKSSRTLTPSECGRVHIALYNASVVIERLETDNGELLEALRLVCDLNPSQHHIHEVARRHAIARAAIARATAPTPTPEES